MAKREFLQLAHNYEEGKYGIASWYMSEKLDGMRAFWDSGITRGKYVDEVPFANTEKDGRYIQRHRATGLWSRYGKPIQAPDWWLDKLPAWPLDGELYTVRGGFQEVMSTVKDLKPGPGWQRVKFMVFDTPSLLAVFRDGTINVTNFKKTFFGILGKLGVTTFFEPRAFESSLGRLRKLDQNDVFIVHHQEQLPFSTNAAVSRMMDMLSQVTSLGGEGLILRAPHSIWTPERVRTLLKVKRLQDMEGTVIGYVWGRKTDLGSKLLGLMGALVLKLDSGVRLELSGFTDEERVMCFYEGADHAFERARQVGEMFPGEVVGSGIHNPTFPLDSRVTFKYRELTLDGVPKEARYWRKDG